MKIFSNKRFSLVFLAILGLVLAACTEASVADSPTALDYALNHQNILFQQAKTDTGWKELTHSEELNNILTRVSRQNDPNHISYLYEISFGKIMGFYPIVGKCTSTDSAANNTQVDAHDSRVNQETYYDATVDAPSLDGSYGTNEPGIFCFLDRPGRPMITWHGDFQISDTYLKLSQPPELVLTTSGHAAKVHH